MASHAGVTDHMRTEGVPFADVSAENRVRAHAPELLAALEGIIRQNTDVIQAYRDVIGTESEPAWIFDLRESTTEARAAIRAAKGEGTDDQSGDSITSTRFKD